jgi:hypothetical protein
METSDTEPRILGLLDQSPDTQLDTIIRTADELSLPFCHLKVVQLLSLSDPSTRPWLSDIVFRSMINLIEQGSTLWAHFIPTLGHDIARRVSNSPLTV